MYDVVGPVCESGDWLGRDRTLAVREGGLVALLSAGAYGMSMASNYNTRNRAAEVMISGSDTRLIRQRETIDMQLAAERACL
jgi:diaminopimelate decarboxylase